MNTQKQTSNPLPQVTPAMIAACKKLLLARTWLSTVEPIVRGYERKILEGLQFTNRREFEKYGEKFPECKLHVITEPKQSYLLADEDFQVYWQLCKLARDAAKLVVEQDDFCPLCVAEHEVSKAERALLDAMKPITTLSADDLSGSLEYWRKGVELCIGAVAAWLKIGNGVGIEVSEQERRDYVDSRMRA